MNKIASFVVAIGFVSGSEMPAGAALTLTVDRMDDALAASACTSAPNDCSLRGAIDRANLTPGADTINLPANMTFTLTAHGSNEDANATGDLDILESVTINGSGSTVDGDADDRCFDILHNFIPGTVTINDLTVINGQGAAAGAGLFVEFGTFIANYLTVTANHTVGGDGGGGIALSSRVQATLSHLTLSSNTAEMQGGGMAFYGFDGSLRISDSTITGNAAASGGGADVSGNVTIENSDFTDNHALGPPPMTPGQRDGGGLRFVNGSLTIRGGCFTANSAPSGSGGAMYVIGDADVSGTQVKDNNAGRGAGVFAAPSDQNGHAVFDHMVISGNDATGSGGGMQLFGAVTLTNSEISANTAVSGGAGIQVNFPDTILDRDLIVSNTTQGNGGGIAAASTSSGAIANTTIVANTAGGQGAGIFKGDLPGFSARGVLAQLIQVRYATIDNNFAQQGAGNIHVLANSGGVSLLGSIVAYPGLQQNCNVAVASSGYNVEDGHSCGLSGPGDQQNADPFLLSLIDNGGPTRTQALQDGSSAVDRVTSGCPPPTTDQRGYVRPAGLACDAGAFELGAFTPPPTSTHSPTPTPTLFPPPSASPTSTSTSPTPAPTLHTPTATGARTPTHSPTATLTRAPTQPPTSTSTATATPTASDTATATESPTAAPTPPPTNGPCVGDCDRSHNVTINELVTMVNIALSGDDISTCPAGDQNDDGQITIDEILAAVNNALSRCP